MPFITERIVGMDGVAPGGLASVRLNVGPRYQWLKFFVFVNGEAVANVETVVRWMKLRVNERVRRDLTAKQWRDIARFNKVVPAGNEIPVWFAEIWQNTPADILNTCWDLYGQRSFEVQIQLENLAEPTDTVTIVAYQTYDNVHVLNTDKSIRNRIVEYSTMGVNAPAGWYDVVTLPKQVMIGRLHWMGGAISEVEVTADTRKVFESTKANNDQVLTDAGLNPAVFPFSIVNDLLGTTEALVANSDLNVRIHSTAVNANATALLETISFGF
ncbi:MAG: hypothetical protein LBK99_01590 [Opitutaceae bacterium]|jgi:hypothetical protein|nr:hypothetical protein [Opitutaceae bacterium]